MGVVALKECSKEDYFVNVKNEFFKLIGELESNQCQAMDLSDLEQKLNHDGREILRLMLQSHINHRGLGEIDDTLEGSDKVIRNHTRQGTRKIKSLFGVVETKRLSYGNRGAESLFPKDSHMNLPTTSFSYELQKRAVQEVIKGSYDNAVESIFYTTGQAIPKQQIEHIAIHAANNFDNFYQQQISDDKSKATKNCPLLILTADGKGVVMHKDDLRPATKKKAEKDKSKKLKKRLSPGEKNNSKRMATVASVYNIDKYIRKPEDFKKELASIKLVDNKPKPKPVAKRVWASVEKEPTDVINEMFAEGLRRDPKAKKTWVALVDGNLHQIELIKAKAKKTNRAVTIVCDIIHVLEYLWKAAWDFFELGDNNAEEWVSENFLSILEGKSSIVAAGMRRSATNQKYSKNERAAIDKCAKYLLNKSPYLKYNEYLKQGFPIATGVIEGACRHLVKDRMDITGARWRLQSAESVLKLRSLKSSGDFAEYWKFHEKQEFIRNHKSKYRKASLLNKLNHQKG
jgi:hypothetical protein